jgi:LacI family transcriptional regulator
MRAAYTFESGVLAARKMLARSARPTAIFCGNDEMAAGVYQAAREAGLRIGEDLAVIGFDDSPLSARLWPPLTSVCLPIRDMGRTAARMLLSEFGVTPQVAAPAAIAPIIVPALVVRASTAARP